ncbi:hypothetical protein C0J52_20186 [Blattella germanica]|nr:hypothetical protein C0J52_20186 [Blattella germanica]
MEKAPSTCGLPETAEAKEITATAMATLEACIPSLWAARLNKASFHGMANDALQPWLPRTQVEHTLIR